MGDIIDNEEIDKDTVTTETLNQLFPKKYRLLIEKAVSLKQSYINKLSVTKSLKVAVSLLDNRIEVYELSNTSINRICQLSGHQKALTDIVFSPKEDYLIYSCGLDGNLKLWDTRASGSCVQEYVEKDKTLLKPYECMDVSCNGRVLCGGTQLVEDDAYLVFWDQRKAEALGGYWNSHTEDISQVKFHKEKTEILATGSLDSLLNIFNIMEQTEDDALLYSLNVENSVEKLTWLDNKRIACITQSNDLQLWDSDSGDMIKSFSREKIAKSIKRSKPDDCYLVDVLASGSESPLLLAGSYGGDGNVLRSVTVGDKLHPASNLANKQIVRCAHYDTQKDLLITAGESGLISVWTSGDDEDLQSSNVNRVINPLKKLHVNRHKPY